MIILSWNCRGLGSLSAISNLRNIAQRHNPDLIFLSETLANARKMETVRVTLKFDSCLAVDVDGRSGGLAVLWRNNIKCRVLNYSQNFVNMMIEDDIRGQWRLTCYYGFPERGRRKLAWDMLRDLRDMSDNPWCIIGDFNDLLSQEDKRGIHLHLNWLCNGFRNAVEECNLTDISIEGYQFTWTKSRGTPHMIEERLDRAMATTQWLELFPNVRLLNLPASHSDHNPIILYTDPTERHCYRYSFKFENKWLLEEDIREVVEAGWGPNRGMEISDRLGGCAEELRKWSRRKRS
ncbi:uncharacterized protein LOC131614157 [Vicia villosa]|uniref:uncharacterized protein LOC131614157 n=1 Tax=Vicia villosa TaxID=3911 RepID=UPI00273B600E|nr:uncharacterized protein LOC131614157 [Vicia villosa]